MQPIVLNLDLINGILGYLGSRPYGEVFQLITAINNIAGPQVQAQAAAPAAPAEAQPTETPPDQG